MKAEKFFTAEQKALLVQAIQAAELNTSGEVRVHIESTCGGVVLDRAAYIFKKLDMHKTALRNGVLFYLSLNDRRFAILGDAGINAKVADTFWNEVKDLVIKNFKEEKFTEGLVQGIALAGEKLKENFPYQSNDKNELTDEVSFN